MYYKSKLENSEISSKYFILKYLDKFHAFFFKKFNALHYCCIICKSDIYVISL